MGPTTRLLGRDESMSTKRRWSMLAVVAIIAAATGGTVAISQDDRADHARGSPGKFQKGGVQAQAPLAEAREGKKKVYSFNYGAFDQDQKNAIVIAVNDGKLKGYSIALQNERYYKDPDYPDYRGYLYDVDLGGNPVKFLLGTKQFYSNNYAVVEYDDEDNVIYSTTDARRAPK
jgi:hypothetical protein